MFDVPAVDDAPTRMFVEDVRVGEELARSAVAGGPARELTTATVEPASHSTGTATDVARPARHTSGILGPVGDARLTVRPPAPRYTSLHAKRALRPRRRTVHGRWPSGVDDSDSVRARETNVASAAA